MFVEWLLNRFAEFNVKNKNGVSALQIAEENKFDEVAKRIRKEIESEVSRRTKNISEDEMYQIFPLQGDIIQSRKSEIEIIEATDSELNIEDDFEIVTPIIHDISRKREIDLRKSLMPEQFEYSYSNSNPLSQINSFESNNILNNSGFVSLNQPVKVVPRRKAPLPPTNNFSDSNNTNDVRKSPTAQPRKLPPRKNINKGPSKVIPNVKRPNKNPNKVPNKFFKSVKNNFPPPNNSQIN